MAQHDYFLENSPGIVFRSDLNDALNAIVSQNSSATEPTTKFAYMFWADTSTGILKQRDSLNAIWNNIYNLSTGQWLGSISGNAATVSVADAASDTTMWPLLAGSQTGDQTPRTDAGLSYNASTNKFNNLDSSGSVTSASPTAGVGYATGAGGSVTQLTSISTPVTLDKVAGAVTTVVATVAAGSNYNFVVNNSTVEANDSIVLTMVTPTSISGTAIPFVSAIVNGSFRINLYITLGGTLSFKLNFSVIKSVVS